MSAGIIAGNVMSANVLQVTWDIPSVAANTTEEETFTVNGVKTGDYVHVSKSDLDAGIIFGSARVTADNTVGVQISNPTSGAVNAASETVQVLVIRPENHSLSQNRVVA